MNSTTTILRISVALLLIALLGACSTQKKRGELTKFQKFYHNTTSEFNGYFNANILLEESMVTLNNQVQDNYNKILPVYKYTEADDPNSVANDLDEAIKKVSVVVSLHRESDWVDDCYLLMGKAMFLKQDYESAQEALEYMVAEFNPDAVAKRKSRKKAKRKKSKKEKQKEIKEKKKKREKKKKQKQKEIKRRKKARKKGKKVEPQPKLSKEERERLEQLEKEEQEKAEELARQKEAEEAKAETQGKGNYFLKHRPCYQEGVLWLAKTYVERDNHLRAEQLFRELEENPFLFEDVKDQLAPAMAYFYLDQKKNEMAVPYLQAAVERTKDKNERARYAFSLAQIHQQAGRSQEALANFALAKKYSNRYEMEFASELNVLKNSWKTGQQTEEQVVKTLERMLKETKNAEYQDRIYFVLADIALQSGDKIAAKEYLAKSLETNSLNKIQKAESNLLLADLYFDDEEYVEAKANYDAALTALPKSDERYNRVEQRASGLTDIVKNIEIIALQDSLLRISQLSDDDKRKLAAELKRREIQEKLENAKAINEVPVGATPNFANTSTGIGGVSSNFFAYSDKSLKKGRREFESRWPGRTTLEDNWRRSNRATTDIDTEIADISSYEKALTEEEIAATLKGVPVTAADIQQANDQIMRAMFELGVLYRDRLNKPEKAIETLEALNARYPGSVHELESWYFLYLAAGDVGDNTKKQQYFDKIMDKYGNTIYARVLKDPDYLAQTKDKESKLNDYYDETYVLFTNGEYVEVKDRIQGVNRLFGGNNSHQPRFALLNAMTVGALPNGGKEAYITELKSVIGRYPNTPEEKRAKEILRLLGDKSVVNAGKVESAKEGGSDTSIFKDEDDKVHYGIVVFDNRVDLSKVKADISDYNRTNHKLDRLRISNIYLASNTSRPVIIIRKFNNKAASMKYYRGAVKDPKDFLSVDVGYDFFMVNQYNYRQILREKSVDGYRLYFAEKYLGGN